jgi:PPE-repeat protein
MTLGITGVFWLPRTATVNSLALHAGAHAVPISAASPAWAALSASYVDATATVARVIAELAVGLQGVNGLAATAKLTGFAAWAERSAEAAATMSAKTAANATAYTVASLAMPSPPEIAAVKTAKVAAYSTGGVLNGTAEAAEAADRLMDLRAAAVMEAYEAATTTTVMTPSAFTPPPTIAAGAGNTQAGGQETDAVEALRNGNPVQAASLAASALAQNPAVQSVAAQAGHIAGTAASSTASAVSNIGGAAMSAATNAASAPSLMASQMASQMPPLAGFGAAGAAGNGGGASTRAAGVGGGDAAAVRMPSVALPEGWGGAGGAAGLGGNAAAGGVAAVAGPDAGQSTFGSTRVDPAAAARGSGMGPLAGTRGPGFDDDEDEHETPDYLRNVEHFEDGRMVVPAVLGADPDMESRR